MLFVAAGCAAPPTPPIAPTPADAGTRLAAVEARYGGRLGVSALDTGTGARISHRGAERFALCSTFKWTLAAAVLSRVDRGTLSLDTKVPYGPADLLEYAPVTRARAEEGVLDVATLCAAAVEVSDNTAANLLLRLVGGPAGLTEFLRALGDPETRLDRDEPSLNTNLEADPRDTTTPDAMVATMHTLLVGEALGADSRARLLEWMIAATTGKERLRGGWPPAWRAGDKTGTCENGATNDVAIAWPPGRAPILVAAYFTGSPRSPGERNAALAEAARIVAEAFER